MRELSSLMNEALEDRARALAGTASTDTVMGTVRSRVRRRRTVRHVAQAAVAVPVVAAVVLGGWWIQADHDPAPPVTTPTPSLSPTPTPEPTPSTTPTETAAPTVDPLGDLVVEPGYPPYHELPDGMLDQAGPGWVLASVVRRTGEGPSTQTEERLFLVRPDGTRMLLHVLPTGVEVDDTTAAWSQYDVLEWDPAAGTALLLEQRCEETFAGPYAGIDGSMGCGPDVASRMDLRTGTLEPVLTAPESASSLVGRISDDRWLWLPYPGGSDPFIHVSGPDGDQAIETQGTALGWAVVSPDGRLVATGYPDANGEASFVVTDLDDGGSVGVVPVSGPHGSCRTLGWWDRERIVASCREVRTDGTGGPVVSLVTFDMAQVAAGDGRGDVVRTFGVGEVAPEQGWARIADGVLAVSGREVVDGDPSGIGDCDERPYLLTAQGMEPVPVGGAGVGGYAATPADGTLYVSARGCSAGEPDILVAYDLSTGTTVELVAPPAADEGGRYTSRLTSHAVAR